MTRLLLVRHGETEWNKQGRYHGITDIELSEVGLEQADRLAQRLPSSFIDEVITGSSLLAQFGRWERLIQLVPVLMDEKELAGIDEKLTADHISIRLREIYLQALQPAGSAAADSRRAFSRMARSS